MSKAIKRISDISFNGPNRAILAGSLVLLAESLEAEEVAPDDGDIGDILTSMGEYNSLSPANIHNLAFVIQAYQGYLVQIRKFEPESFNAIVAALRLLATKIESGASFSSTNHMILTAGGSLALPPSETIHQLADLLLFYP